MENKIGWNYSDIVKDHFLKPRNILTISEDEYKADGVGYVGSPACGDMMKVLIKVKDNIIYDLKWLTFGCASAIGSTSMLSVMVTENGGIPLEEAYKITPEMIMNRLGGLPTNKIHCSVLGDKALKEAINDYYTKNNMVNKIKANDESVIVCECLNITMEDIKMEVLEGVKDFKTLQERTKIGTGCGKCIEKVKGIQNQFIKEYFKTK